MTDAAIETDEQGGGFGSDDGGFEIGTGEIANGVEGVPGGLDGDFDFVFGVAKRDLGSQVPRDAAKLGQNAFGKVFEILGQLRFGGASGPAAEDCARRSGGRNALFLANDDFPGPHFPLFDKTVYNIGVLAGEGFDFAFIVDTKDDQRAVYRVGESAGWNEFAAC